MREIVIGTRGSALALWQANAVEVMLRERMPELSVRQEIIHTTGDKILDSPLNMIGDKGLFTKELEQALYDGRIDIAVHSLKDLPSQLPPGLAIAAVTKRHHVEDALVGRPGTTLQNLPQGATVATGSLRRRAQLLHLRPDLVIVDARGNVPTRLQKFQTNGWDGMVLAYAGLDRLGLGGSIAEIIPSSVMIPAVGQGALGIEAREDAAVNDLLKMIDHAPTRVCTAAERALLRELEGGCQVPIGAHATLDDDVLTLNAVIASVDGRTLVRDTIVGQPQDAEQLGVALGRQLLEAGGAEILDAMLRNQ